jgi:hypothetical protein
MKFREIAEKIKSGEMSFNFCGHLMSEYFQERFLEIYQDTIDGSLGKHDGKWKNSVRIERGETMEDVNRSMREHYARTLDCDVEEGEPFWGGMDNDAECHGCGKRLKWVLNGNTLAFRCYYDHDANNFVQHPANYVCPYATPRPFKGEIKVASKLIFVNFFKEDDDYKFKDCPEDKEHTSEWSVGAIIGRENITAHKAAQNVAYGQMTNTSVGIYLHPNKKSVIVGDLYVADRRIEAMPDEVTEKMTSAEYKKMEKELSVIEGHKLVGRVGLCVWRWEATDLKTLGAKSYKEHKELKKEHRDMVELTVKHGVWQFEHYFDSHTAPDDMSVYSRFTLKEK